MTDNVTCLAIGDPHFQVNNVPDAQDLIKKVNHMVEQLNPTFVVILGDLLHTHEKIHVTPFNLATKLIKSLSEKVQVFLIIGNHDYCFAKNVPILMWDGSTKMSQDIRVGDKLVGDDFMPTTVVRLIRGISKLFHVNQIGGTSYTVTGNHKLCLKWKDYTDTIDISVADYFKLSITDREQLYGYRLLDNELVLTNVSITEGNVDKYYGWELSENHRFLLSDSTVTHNCNNQQFLTSNHPFNSFKTMENVTVCDKVILKYIFGHKFVFCPYVPPERFEEALDTLETKGKTWDDATCIFAHQEFYGCRFNPIKTSIDGDIWPENYPMVISGHIHDEQLLQPNIYYTGSSMQHAFGEASNKTVAFVTFADKIHIQQIDPEMRKRKIVYKKVQDVDRFVPENNVYTKLVIKGSPGDLKTYRKSKGYKRLQSLGLAISFVPDVVTSTATNPPENKQDVLDILQELIKNDNIHVKNAFEKLKYS